MASISIPTYTWLFLSPTASPTFNFSFLSFFLSSLSFSGSYISSLVCNCCVVHLVLTGPLLFFALFEYISSFAAISAPFAILLLHVYLLCPLTLTLHIASIVTLSPFCYSTASVACSYPPHCYSLCPFCYSIASVCSLLLSTLLQLLTLFFLLFHSFCLFALTLHIASIVFLLFAISLLTLTCPLPGREIVRVVEEWGEEEGEERVESGGWEWVSEGGDPHCFSC